MSDLTSSGMTVLDIVITSDDILNGMTHVILFTIMEFMQHTDEGWTDGIVLSECE